MIYKQVRANDGSHTNLQVIIGEEGGKPVFQHFGKKVPDRVHIENGTVLSLENAPKIGADKAEYFKVVGLAVIPSVKQNKDWDKPANWTSKPLPNNWPKDGYVKGHDMTAEYQLVAPGSAGWGF